MTSAAVAEPGRSGTWGVLACGALVLAIGMGTRSVLGIFLPDMTLATGISMAVFSLAFAIQNLLWGLLAPVAGIVADRIGTVSTILIGAVLYAAGLVLMAVSDDPLSIYGSIGLLIGGGIGFSSFSIVLGAVGRLVPEDRRSMALGITSAGGSLGQFVMAPTTGVLVLGIGWQSTLFVLAAIAMLIAPAALALGERRAARGSRIEPCPNGCNCGGTIVTDAPVPMPRSAATETPMPLREAIGQAFGHNSYWLLMSGFFVCGFHIAFITTHLPTFAALCGIHPSAATTSIGIIGLFNIVGTLFAGWLGGRLHKKLVLSGIYALRAMVILAFLAAPKTELSLLVFAGALGFLWLSTVPLTSGLVAHLFGARHMATLYGFVMLSHQIGGFMGAWLGGVVYETTGNYDLIWLISAGLGLAAAAVHLPIDERRRSGAPAPA